MKLFISIILIASLLVAFAACGLGPGQSTETTDTKAGAAGESAGDKTYVEQEGVDLIYLAGGCFWGMEKLMQALPGVIQATSGYANGQGADPSYAEVSSGNTGYRETVRVEYKPDQLSLDMILFTFFRAIDPTTKNRQGNDVGSQYQSGIYYTDDSSRETVERITDVERLRYQPFEVEIKPLTSFYDAEEYHQDYLNKNPGGYCHIVQDQFDLAANMIIDPAHYPRPSDDAIAAKLTKTQYDVTQNAATDPPFDSEFWDNEEKGIYVDIVTGEPLFSSRDKFASGTGWPSFTKSIDDNTLVLLADNSLGMIRTEVRSRAGNSHLGHVFYGEEQSPSGVRFCINGSALKFIPDDQIEAEGYAYLENYLD